MSDKDTNGQDKFKAMMAAAREKAGLNHPEVNEEQPKSNEGGNPKDLAEAHFRSIFEDAGIDSDNVRVTSLNLSDPVDEAKARELFGEDAIDALIEELEDEDYEEPEGDLMEVPESLLMGDAFEELMADVMSEEDYLSGYMGEYMGEVASDSHAYDQDEMGADPWAFLEGALKDEGERFHARGRENRANILRTAEQYVNGDRNNQYGDPKQDFQRTADYWSTYLDGVLDREDGDMILRPHDVAVMQILLKVSRIGWTPAKKDHWVDLAGYAACGADCAEAEYDGWV